jgi:hypothetical protein
MAAPPSSIPEFRSNPPAHQNLVCAEQGNSPQPLPTARQAEQAAERVPSAAEAEFVKAMQDYKASSGRMFPTWSEVLEVLKGLGYEKVESD